MKHARLAGNVLALCVIVIGSATPSMAHSSINGTTLVVVNQTYPAGHPQGQSILDWVTRHASDYAPRGRNGEVRLERMNHSNPAGPLAPAQSSDLPGPPGKLPEQGAPGEILRMENILPDGTTQTWEFRWIQPSTGHDGYWATAAYSIRLPLDPVNIQ
ncbi:hypothetical protein ACTUVK_000883 [Stenotrophomonas rhizophila]